MKTSKALVRLLRECRKQSGYRNHTWEPGMDYDKENNAANYPFKPEGPQADRWGGDLGCWDDILADAFVGVTLDVYISNREELETNYSIKIISETQAECKDCCGRPYLVTI